MKKKAFAPWPVIQIEEKKYIELERITFYFLSNGTINKESNFTLLKKRISPKSDPHSPPPTHNAPLISPIPPTISHSPSISYHKNLDSFT
jgi:hypothetical protein